jgi:alpha-galactosidase
VPKDPGVTRRSFLGKAISATAVTTAAVSARGQSALAAASTARGSVLLDILRVPDRAMAFSGIGHPVALRPSQSSWQASGVAVEFEREAGQMAVQVSSPAHELTHLHLRWVLDVPAHLRCLGDHWERSYGDLAWRGIVPERVMPWYFLTWDGGVCHGYGVKTGASALCFWQVDGEGISLWMNLSNGGEGVQLGSRRLHAATIVSRAGENREAPIASARALCRRMCEKPRLPGSPLYGSNDWYYAYGKNSAEQTLRDADLMAELSSGLDARPFTVIDDGWRDASRFPDMRTVAAGIRHRNVRPGIWIRPLIAPANTRKELLLPGTRFGPQKERASELAYDPTIPEVLELVTAKAREVVEFGFELVKHDYSTYDLLGRWGFEMGASPTTPGWHLHDRSRTNAEVIRDLYVALRNAVGERTLLLGCNTVGHLGAGIFESQRTGDDTSGQHWERTRKMGVNTLAFRLAQDGTFFALDPDCVGITPAIPWEQNRQWMDVIARSGAALFVSPDPAATGPEQKKAIAEAFRITASGGAGLSAEDWLDNTCPEWWSTGGSGGEVRYRWCGAEGANPFAS